METYSISAAALLVGVPKKRLYQAVQKGRLQATPGAEPGDVMTVTTEALQAAGFTVPSTIQSESSASAPKAPARPKAAKSAPAQIPEASPQITPTPVAAAAPVPQPAQDQAIIAHLERALAAAEARENRLLDLLAHITGTVSTAPAPGTPKAPAAAKAAAPSSRVAAPQPQGSLRQQIIAILQSHPEGLAPQTVRTMLKLDREVRSTMKGMVRSGLLTRLEAGRYVVATSGANS